VTEISDVRYARSGDVSIAYQVIGDGPIDLVFVRGITGGLLSTWERPLLARHVLGPGRERPAPDAGQQGTGLSDRVADLPTLETRMDDVRAVMTRSARRTPSRGAGWRGEQDDDAVRGLLPRAHDRARRPEPLDQGAAHRRLPVGAIGRHMARDAAVLLGPARARRALRSARGRGRATRLSTMRGEYTWVDDATHETAKGAAKTPTVGKLAGHDQSDRPVGPGGTLEFPLGCRLGGNFRSARAGRCIPLTHREVVSGLLMRYTSKTASRAGDP